MKSQKVLILVPPIVTVGVVMMVSNTHDLGAAVVAPVVHHLIQHVHHVVGTVIRSLWG